MKKLILGALAASAAMATPAAAQNVTGTVNLKTRAVTYTFGGSK